MTLIIQDPKAVAFLTDPDCTRFLKPFLFGERTIKEAAEALHVEPSALYYPVKRMCNLGLLEVAREVPRRGRALKVYRASAEKFFVPFESTGDVTFEAFIATLNAQWEAGLLKGVADAHRRAAGRAEGWGLSIYTHSSGLMVLNITPVPDANPHPLPGVIFIWDTGYYLSDEDVGALDAELASLLARYREKRSGPRRVLRVALAPWGDA